MTDSLLVQPVARPVEGDVRVPGSKSITNRALMLAALADGTSHLEGALFSDDTHYMSEALRQLQIPVRADAENELFEVDGQGRVPAQSAELFVGNSGTSARFLTALVALGNGTFRLDGVERMRQRPIRDLLSALQQLGVDARDDLGSGCLPVTVRADGLRGGRCTMRGDASSQFLSALLMAAPLSENGIEITIEGDLFSIPYIEITLRMMQQWGAQVLHEQMRRFHVPGAQKYRAQNYGIEPDASGASYFWAAAALTGGRGRVFGIGENSLQGDAAFVDVLEKMGCAVVRGADFIEVRGPQKLRGVDVDMNAISDTVMTLAAIAPFADAPVNIRNVGHIRHKETDRIHAVVTELRRLGVRVEERADGLTIFPASALQTARVETYDDHRMAMSFAITGLKSPGVTILDPGCVAKTFPDFFERLGKLCGMAQKEK
jgi:3-phosphoshikimate 1-carboxyvinyltransferase